MSSSLYQSTQTNQPNVQSKLHLIVDDISIALKTRLQHLFGELLTKCDEYDTTNEILLSLPIVKKMLNTNTPHTSNIDSDDCVFIKKEKVDPIVQTCTFNYDSLIGFIPPKIDDDDRDDCAMTNAPATKEDPTDAIRLYLMAHPPVEKVNARNDDDVGDCDKCNERIIFSKDGYYVFTKDEEEMCWCQCCFEAGWKQMYKDGWDCDAYDDLDENDPELVDVRETPEKHNNAEVNISLNIEEVEEDEDEDGSGDEDQNETDGEEQDAAEDVAQVEQQDAAQDAQQDAAQDAAEGEEDDAAEEDVDAEDAAEDPAEEDVDVEDAAENDAAEEDAAEEDAAEEDAAEEDAAEDDVEEEEVVTEEEEEAVTEDDAEEEEDEEEDEEVFEVEIMGKNYYTNNVSTGDIYEIDSAGDPGDQVGKYVHGVATFTR